MTLRVMAVSFGSMLPWPLGKVLSQTRVGL